MWQSVLTQVLSYLLQTLKLKYLKFFIKSRQIFVSKLFKKPKCVYYSVRKQVFYLYAFKFYLKLEWMNEMRRKT